MANLDLDLPTLLRRRSVPGEIIDKIRGLGYNEVNDFAAGTPKEALAEFFLAGTTYDENKYDRSTGQDLLGLPSLRPPRGPPFLPSRLGEPLRTRVLQATSRTAVTRPFSGGPWSPESVAPQARGRVRRFPPLRPDMGTGPAIPLVGVGAEHASVHTASRDPSPSVGRARGESVSPPLSSPLPLVLPQVLRGFPIAKASGPPPLQ